jgi:transmembrane sensor
MASGEQIEGSAADWLARLDRAGLPEALHAQFELWCRADPRHLTAYLRLLSVWNRLDALRQGRGVGNSLCS